MASPFTMRHLTLGFRPIPSDSTMHGFLETKAGPVPKYEVSSNRAKATVLVLPTILGIDTDIEFLTEDIANLGANAIAVDPFWRSNPGPLSHDIEDIRRALERKNAIGRDQAINDAFIYCRTLMAQSPELPLIAVGVSYGGFLAFCSAACGLLKGTVICHGGSLPDHIRHANDIDCQMDIHYGSEDLVIPADDMLLLKEVFSSSEAINVHQHANAKHGFMLQSQSSFNPDAYDACIRSVEKILASL